MNIGMVTQSSGDEAEISAPTDGAMESDQGFSDGNKDDADAANDLQTQRDELIEKFVAHCGRIRGADISWPDSYREKYRLTDLLKWFVDDYSRPFAFSTLAANKDAGGPLTFRKCLEKTGFKLPSSVILPPSQVVDLIIETAPEKSLKGAIGKGIGDNDTPELRSDRRQFSQQPAPNMSRFLFDIGYSLVSEAAYRSVLGKAMSELSNSSSASDASAVERHAQMVEHVRRVYDDAKKQNHPFKLKAYRCPITDCSVTTETQLQMHEHRRKPHKRTHRWLCALCMKFSSWNDEDMEEHYNYEHGFTSAAKWDPPSSRAPCPLCDQDFQFKGQMKNHLRTPGECPMNVRNVKLTTGVEAELDDVLNVYLWPKVDERRSMFGSSFSQARKSQERNSALHLYRPKDGEASANHGKLVQYKGVLPMRSGHQQSRVADVVNFVAAGQGQLKTLSKSATNGSPAQNLPRLFPAPASILRTTHSQQQTLLSQMYAAQQQPALPRSLVPSVLAQASPAGQQRSSACTYCCEICDAPLSRKLDYFKHLQIDHRKLLDKSEGDLAGAAPLACSRCRDRFYSYEGLERHLLMEHNLVTNELLSKAQKRQDSGKCRICSRIYAFNLLQHLVQDHQRTLCSAEIVYSCDVCFFQCNSYVQLELHLRNHHTGHAAQNGTTSTSATQPHGYSQASNALSMIAQRQQAMLVVRSPPRMTSQLTSRASTQPQTAATVLNVALNRCKRPANDSPASEQMERAPKLIKMTGPSSQGTPSASDAMNSGSCSTLSNVSRSSVGQAQMANRKQLRYCCTPCDLKFISYEAVLKHWVERHLKPLRIPLCRIDKCTPCQGKLTLPNDDKSNAQKDEEADVLIEEDPPVKEVDCTDDATKRTGLILNLELPELSENDDQQQPNGDNDVEILSSSPREVIFLD